MKNNKIYGTMEKARAGLKDNWNAYMLENAEFTSNDIPKCPTTAVALPRDIITWEEAKSIYKQHRIKGDLEFKHNAYVCWYMDDYKFDGVRGIWHDSAFALKVAPKQKVCHQRFTEAERGHFRVRLIVEQMIQRVVGCLDLVTVFGVAVKV